LSYSSDGGTISSLHEGIINSGEFFNITISGSSCSGKLLVFFNDAFVVQYEGPNDDVTDSIRTYIHNFDMDGVVRMYWSGSYSNEDCGLEITDSLNNEIYFIEECDNISDCLHDGPQNEVVVELEHDSIVDFEWVKTYDENGNVLTYYQDGISNFKVSNGIYDYSAIFTYDNNGNLLTYEQDGFESTGGADGIVDYTYSYTYDVNGNRVTYSRDGDSEEGGANAMVDYSWEKTFDDYYVVCEEEASEPPN
jgi:hypothetical protein